MSCPLNYVLEGVNCVKCIKIMKLIFVPLLLVLKDSILIILYAKNVVKNVLIIKKILVFAIANILLMEIIIKLINH